MASRCNWSSSRARTVSGLMASRELELYGPQYEFVRSSARRAAFVGGIGSGKTIAGVARALAFAGERRCLGVVLAPTYSMLRDATLRTFMELGEGLIEDFNKSEMVARLRNGSEVLFRNADDPGKRRGPNLHWAYLDEAALCGPDIWPVLLGRLRQFGEPGYAWLTTTPKGRNWVWQRFVQEQMVDHAVIRARTHDNPYLMPEFVQGLEREYRGAFAAQELHGEFVAYEGLIYDEFRREAHVWYNELPHFERLIMGIDWGYTNPAVTLVIGIDSDGRALVLDEYYRRGVSLDTHVAATLELQQQWGAYEAFCDPSEPEHIARMREMGIAAHAAPNAVIAGIQAVKSRLTMQGDGLARLYVTERCPYLISEIESYAWAERKGERIDQPEKTNDHAMDARRYAIMGRDVSGQASAEWL